MTRKKYWIWTQERGLRRKELLAQKAMLDATMLDAAADEDGDAFIEGVGWRTQYVTMTIYNIFDPKE